MTTHTSEPRALTPTELGASTSPRVPELSIALADITVLANPRAHYDKAALEELAASIERDGQLQAVIVRTAFDAATPYELIAGTRRLRAMQLLMERHPGEPRFASIRASVQDHHTGHRIKVVQAVENIRRAELTTLELASAMNELKEALTDQQIAEELGYTRRHVERLIAIHNAPEWLRRCADAFDIQEPVLDEAGNRVIEPDGRPRFQKRRVPAFNMSDVNELLSFFRQLDAWDRKQQDASTTHRPKAESEAQRLIQRAAIQGLSGDRLKELLRARLAEVTGVLQPKLKDKKDDEAPQVLVATDKRLTIDLKALTAPLGAEELGRVRAELTPVLQRLGFTTIRLS